MEYSRVADKPLKYIFQRGGGLSEEERKDYFWRCKNLKCTSDPKEFEKSLLLNLQILEKLVEEKFGQTTQYNDKIRELQKNFESIKAQGLMGISMDLTSYNIKSLQYVILLDKLFYAVNPTWKSTYVNQKVIQEYFKFMTDASTKGIWLNFKLLYDYIYTKQNLLKYTNELISKNTSSSSCCPIISRSRILVSLGEMTLSELVESLSDGIFLVGITPDLQWADGEQHTPYEFMLHDIIHSRNFEYAEGVPLNEIVKKFITLLIENKNGINPELYDKLMIVLFIVLHESQSIYTLFKKIKPNQNKLYFDTLDPSFIKNIEYWKDPYFYGGLLPAELLTKSDEDVKKYLENMFETFKDIYNKYLDTGNISFLVESSAKVSIPKMGSNSAFFYENQEGGRRKSLKKTKRKSKNSKKVKKSKKRKQYT